MQTIYDFLLSMDEINRDLLINGILLLIDLVILTLLLPFAIERLENRKWKAMRQSLLHSTLDLMESTFTYRPYEIPGAYLDRQRHAALDDAIFGKLQLFSTALTPAQSASVANAVELSLQLVKPLDQMRMNMAVIESNKDQELTRKNDRECHLSFQDYATKMLTAAIALEALPLRERARGIVAEFEDPVASRDAEAQVDRLVEHVETVLTDCWKTIDMLINRSPRTASMALRRSKADTLLPEYFGSAQLLIRDIYAEWDAEKETASEQATDDQPDG